MRNSIRIKQFFPLIFVVSLALSQSDSTARRSVPAGLADAERAFSALSEKEGIKNSFLAYFDDDCIMFNPHPVNGRQLYASGPPSSAFLSWYPVFVEAAASGDFGISTGPWEIKKSRQDTVRSVGYFFSVWKKNREGHWRVVLDLGVGFPKEKMKKEPEHFSMLNSSEKKSTGKEPATEGLSSAENSFVQSAAKMGVSKAFTRHSADNVRVYRDGNFPSTNKKESEEVVQREEERISYTPLAAHAASSGDLGFTYGYAVNAQNDSSSYVRVWRLVPLGREKEWRIAVDILKPIKP